MSGTLSAESIALLQLNLTAGLGPRLQSLLLARFEHAQSIFRASARELLEVDGIGPKVSSAIVQGRDFAAAADEWRQCEALGVQVLFRGDADYPAALQEIHDPPPALYVQGTLLERDQLAVAIVGSRQCTHYGRQQAGAGDRRGGPSRRP
jgi:DNA processing protein